MWSNREEGPGSHCSISLPLQWALCALHINQYLTKIASVFAYQQQQQQNSSSYHYPESTTTKQLHSSLRAMYAFEIRNHMISRIVMFKQVFQRNGHRCESGLLQTLTWVAKQSLVDGLEVEAFEVRVSAALMRAVNTLEHLITAPVVWEFMPVDQQS